MSSCEYGYVRRQLYNNSMIKVATYFSHFTLLPIAYALNSLKTILLNCHLTLLYAVYFLEIFHC
jgi:hypothetical protein